MKNTNQKIMCVGLALGLCTFAANATVITYNDFSSTAGLTLVGNAATTTTGDGTVLRVTPAKSGQSGSAYSTSAIGLGNNATFSTTFQFRFTNPGGWDPADGITFVLAASPNGLGGAGVGMGYAGVPNSVAIEFDTYNNAGYGLGDNDGNSSNHVAVDTNGNLTDTALTNVYGNGSCGFPSGGNPDQNTYTVPGCMSNGDLWTVKIGYNGVDLSTTLLDPAEGSTFTAINSLPIDISAILGTNQAFVGFTSGTGAGWENHDLKDWQFANTTQLAPPPGTVPEPTSIALLTLGLAGLGFTRRKRS